MSIRGEVRAMLERRKAGYSLEAPFYNSRDIFDLDLDIVFGRHWICVGVEPDVPEAGDYFTVELGKASVIVARDDDQVIRAFHNVCRHRGSRLCEQSRGSVAKLVCPYHQWTYDLRGQLVFNKHMGPDFDRRGHGLRPVHLRSLAGLLFICLAEQPPADFEDMRAAMEPYIAPHRVADCKIARQVDIIEEGNWKITMENNRECYHCSGNHPELTTSLVEHGFGAEPNEENIGQLKDFDERMEREHRRWEALGLPSAVIDRLGDRTGYRTARLPLSGHGESQTMDTKVASQRLLGAFTRRDLGGLSFWTQPNSWHHFMSDHIVTFNALPLSANRTLVRTRWLVHKEAREGVDYDPDNLVSVWTATNEQDRRLVDLCQQGSGMPGYQPGPYSPFTETLLEKFVDWYVRQMSAALG